MSAEGEGEPNATTVIHRPMGRWPYLSAALPLLLVEYATAMTARTYGSSAYGPPFLLRWLQGPGAETVGFGIGVIVLACTAALGWLSVRR